MICSGNSVYKADFLYNKIVQNHSLQEIKFSLTEHKNIFANIFDIFMQFFLRKTNIDDFQCFSILLFLLLGTCRIFMFFKRIYYVILNQAIAYTFYKLNQFLHLTYKAADKCMIFLYSGWKNYL